MLQGKGGFLAMILSVLGIVLYVTMFENVMTAFDALITAIGVASPFIALETVVNIAPTVLMIAGVVGSAWGYWAGYKAAAGNDSKGLILMVLGILIIILFVTLFSSIVTVFDALHTLYDGSDYIAFDTVLTIVPTILFLGGIFAGVGTATSGVRKFRKSRRGALAV